MTRRIYSTVFDWCQGLYWFVVMLLALGALLTFMPGPPLLFLAAHWLGVVFVAGGWFLRPAVHIDWSRSPNNDKGAL